MSKNIYKLFREYNKIEDDTEKSKFLVSLSYEMRETFKNLISYSNNTERFEIIYDGWINSIEEELVVLEIYSVILNSRRDLQDFCVNDKVYKQFIENKKTMLTLLLENKQYEHAKKLLEVHMFNEEYKRVKLDELREKVLEYLITKKMVLPKKLINEIYQWVDALKVPPYLVSDIDGEFQFTITNEIMSINSLQEDIEAAYSKKADLKKIVDNLIEKNTVK